jgi:hypothetical protein
MARSKLPLSHYEAAMVRMPLEGAGGKIIEALRIEVFGPYFPQRAVEPELLIGQMIARRISIALDQRSIRGYFHEVPEEGMSIRVRYGDSQEGELRDRFSRKTVRPIPKDWMT